MAESGSDKLGLTYHLCCRRNSGSGKSVHLLEILPREEGGSDDAHLPSRRGGEERDSELVLGHVDWS